MRADYCDELRLPDGRTGRVVHIDDGPVFHVRLRIDQTGEVMEIPPDASPTGRRYCEDCCRYRGAGDFEQDVYKERCDGCQAEALEAGP